MSEIIRMCDEYWVKDKMIKVVIIIVRFGLPQSTALKQKVKLKNKHYTLEKSPQ